MELKAWVKDWEGLNRDWIGGFDWITCSYEGILITNDDDGDDDELFLMFGFWSSVGFISIFIVLYTACVPSTNLCFGCTKVKQQTSTVLVYKTLVSN